MKIKKNKGTTMPLLNRKKALENIRKELPALKDKAVEFSRLVEDLERENKRELAMLEIEEFIQINSKEVKK